MEDSLESAPLFTPLKLKISHGTQGEIRSLLNPVLEALAKQSIHKVTVSFSPIDIHQFQTKVELDSHKKHREVTAAIELKNVPYPSTIFMTQVTSESSQIPVVVLNFDDHCNQLVERIREEIERGLPSHLEVCPDPMSLYLIGSQVKTGPLWKVHRDNCEQRLHIVISECDESFVWYENADGEREVGSFQFSQDSAVILAVSEYHTVYVRNYRADAPRIHLVADLRTEDVSQI